MLIKILAKSWPFLGDRKVKWEEERMGLLHSRTVVSMCAQQGPVAVQRTDLMAVPVLTFELAGEIHLLSQMLQSRIE